MSASTPLRWILGLLLVVGCDEARRTSTSTPRSTPRDASALDLGLDDGAIPDLGPTPDLGPRPDLGPLPDLGAPDGGAPDAGPADLGAATPDGGFAADAAPSLPFCQKVCATPSDCAVANSPIQTAAHYRCATGVCEYLGCRDHNECVMTFSDPSYGCHRSAGASIAGCVKRCATSADCVVANGGTLFDADNYACNAGFCEWVGCHTDMECASTHRNPQYVCRRLAGWTLSSCVEVCATPADCAGTNAVVDADNYRCAMGLCEYTGCNSTAECRSAFMSTDYVCR